MMTLDARSAKRLEGVHPDLVKVVMRAAEISHVAFIVTEGERLFERQKQLFDEGKSKTMRSRHVKESNKCNLSCAVDLAVWEDKDEDRVVDNGELDWRFEMYSQLAKFVKQAADEVGVPIEWGGDWKTFRDGPHFQLPWGSYP